VSDWESFGKYLGEAYLRYSFTKGTVGEVDFLIDALGLDSSMTVLDVGCGPGRHTLRLAELGIAAHGIDLSPEFVELARTAASAGATFEVGDATALGFDGCFDAAVALCQGAFGSLPFDAHQGRVSDPQHLGGDLAVLDGMRRAVRPGGRIAVTAFNAYFQVRWLEDTDRFDAATAVNLEETELRDPLGAVRPVTLSTTCSTPRELRLMFERVGLVVDDIWSVSPGEYRRLAPTIDRPELLVLAHRPA